MAYSRTLNHFTSMQELATIWASSTSYVVNQLVIESDKLYRCLVAHTSGGTFIADLQAAYWVEISASEAGVFNYIGNPDAEVDASGWTTYAESDSVTFTDAGDLVTLNNHGLSNGNEISFTSITSTTGISVNTRYFVVSATTNTFQVASSSGGSALPLTTNGSGTMVRFVPKTGSGGSPNITWSRSIVSPLRGDADFNLVKDAANRQGQGVEYDFTIDNADLAKVLTVTFDYEVVSGTLATGDVTVYLIQDPSGTPLVIQPAGYQVQGATVGTKMRQIATFQTSSTVTSYRLCLHVSSVSASAYTLAVDNVVVGPQVVQYGAPVTDWQSFTPTGSWTTNVTYTGRYRRVGDKMDVEWMVQTSGAPNATGLTLNLPSGFSIDTSKILDTTVGAEALGRGSVLDAGVGYYPNLLLRYNGTTSVDVLVDFQGAGGTAVYTAGTPVTQAVPFTFGAGDKVYATAQFPILGWSSTVQMSNDTDTRVVAFRGYLATNTALTADVTKIPYTATVDTHGAWSSANSTYTVAVPGQYEILSRAISVAGGGYIRIYRNGSYLAYLQNFYASQGLSGSFLGNFNAGDVLDFRSTGSITLTGDADINTAITIKRLSGPSAIAASETVAASYWLPANQSSGTTTPINFSSRQFDSHGAVTTGAAWRFTAPVAGTYNVSIFAYVSGASVSYNLYKNGVLYTDMAEHIPGQVATASLVIQLIAGDYLDLRTGATQTVFGSTFNTYSAKFHIHRIGN